MGDGKTMVTSRRQLIKSGLVTAFAAGSGAHAFPALASGAPVPDLTDPAEWLDLWGDHRAFQPPAGLTEVLTERSVSPGRLDRALSAIARPRMAVFRPPQGSNNGGALLIAPGGGYRRVVMDREGFEMARWAAEQGFTAFALFYRLPADGWAAGPDVALADAQRAIRLIRYHAGRWGIDGTRVSVMGFSAGGHVCASLSTRFADQVYAPVDAADSLSARPHSAAPIYPVISMDPAIAHMGSREHLLGAAPSLADEAANSPDRTVPHDAPPHFLLHAEDDASVVVDNCLRFRAALRAAGIDTQTHLFPDGGHGFGISQAAGKSVEGWQRLWLGWALQKGLGSA